MYAGSVVEMAVRQHLNLNNAELITRYRLRLTLRVLLSCCCT